MFKNPGSGFWNCPSLLACLQILKLLFGRAPVSRRSRHNFRLNDEKKCNGKKSWNFRPAVRKYETHCANDPPISTSRFRRRRRRRRRRHRLNFEKQKFLLSFFLLSSLIRQFWLIESRSLSLNRSVCLSVCSLVIVSWSKYFCLLRIWIGFFAPVSELFPNFSKFIRQTAYTDVCVRAFVLLSQRHLHQPQHIAIVRLKFPTGSQIAEVYRI